MKIFLPFKKDLNPYLDTIQQYSEHDFVYGNYKDYHSGYPIVNIHWPEAIFSWREPTLEQLRDLEASIEVWKKDSCIVYTKHDFKRHTGMTPNFTRLFETIENNTNIFIHLGQYSKNLYEKKFPDAQHEVVYHPIYENKFKIYSREEAREKLKIDQDSAVFIAPGKIRSFAERRMLIGAFKRLRKKKKVLIVPTMRSEIKVDFRGRVRLKRWVDVRKYLIKRFKNRYQPPQYLFGYERLEDRDLAIRMAAADVVIVPRTTILNSGTLFLGLAFNRVVIGPETGNIHEQLKHLNMPTFDPKSTSSVTRAMEKGLGLNNSNWNIPDENLTKYKPANVAKEMDIVFKNAL